MQHNFYEKYVWKNHGLWPYAQKQIHFFCIFEIFCNNNSSKKNKNTFLSICIFYIFYIFLFFYLIFSFFYWGWAVSHSGLTAHPEWAGLPALTGWKPRRVRAGLPAIVGWKPKVNGLDLKAQVGCQPTSHGLGPQSGWAYSPPP